MRRRTYLATAGAAVFGGCAGSKDTGGNTEQLPPGSEETGRDETTPDTPASTETETGDESEGVDSESGTAVLREQSFEVHEGEFLTEHGVRAFIENTGDGPLSYVQLDASFYDGGNTLLESSLTNVGWLGAGETWEAWVSYPGDGAGDGVESGEVMLADQSSYSLESPPAVDILEHKLQEEDYGVTVVGRVENTGDNRDGFERRFRRCRERFGGVEDERQNRDGEIRDEHQRDESDWQSGNRLFTVDIPVVVGSVQRPVTNRNDHEDGDGPLNPVHRRGETPDLFGDDERCREDEATNNLLGEVVNAEDAPAREPVERVYCPSNNSPLFLRRGRLFEVFQFVEQSFDFPIVGTVFVLLRRSFFYYDWPVLAGGKTVFGIRTARRCRAGRGRAL